MLMHRANALVEVMAWQDPFPMQFRALDPRTPLEPVGQSDAQ